MGFLLACLVIPNVKIAAQHNGTKSFLFALFNVVKLTIVNFVIRAVHACVLSILQKDKYWFDTLIKMTDSDA